MADKPRIRFFKNGSAHDDALDIAGMPPGFGQPIVPHHSTTAARYAAGYDTYYSGDEAIRDSRQNAMYMRQHTGIRECLLRRQEATALLNWHLQPEDDKDPRQKELCVRLTQILERTKRFTEMRRGLGEAIWYGRCGVQLIYKREKVRGKYASVVRDWLPVNGDKLAFRFDDGSHEAEQGAVGIRVASSTSKGLKKKLTDKYGEAKIHPTERGWAYFMDSSERQRFLLHKYLIEDGPYDDGRQADKVNGVGVRDMIYWTWMQMLDIQSWMMDFLQRSGMGIEIWKYPANNADAKAACESAARNRTDVSILTVPVWPGDDAGMYDIEFKEPGFAGLEAVKDLLQSYYLSQIKRLILGQNLTTESDATGLGSGVSDAHMATWSDIIRCDARGMEEDITDEFVKPLKLYNEPWARDIHVRFVIDTEGDDAASKMDAWRQAYDMGLGIKADDLRDLVGASKPDPEDEVLKSPISEDPSTSFFGGFGEGPNGGGDPEGGPDDGGDEPGGPISGMGPAAGKLMERLKGKYGAAQGPTEPEKYARDYSSTQVDLEGEDAADVLELANEVIREAERRGVLLEREGEPHITVKYGLHTNNVEGVREVITKCCDWLIKATVGDISIFKNDEFDVVKLDIESDDLHRLNASLCDSLENTETYPEYKPHITLAYVKPGEGDAIVESVWNTAFGTELVFDSVTFSNKQRQHTKIPLGETCPQCGGKMVSRERRKNGNDTCENGHVYPSADAVRPEKYAAKFKEDDHPRDEKGRFAMTMRPVFRPIGWSLYTDSHDVIHIPEGEIDFEGDPWNEETEELKPEFLEAIKPWTKGKKSTVEHAERDEEGGWAYGIEWHGKEPEKWTGANSLGEAIYDLVGQNYGDLDAPALKEVAKLLPGFGRKISDPEDEEEIEDFAKALYRHVRKGEGRKVQTVEPEKYAKKFDESEHPRDEGGKFAPHEMTRAEYDDHVQKIKPLQNDYLHIGGVEVVQNPTERDLQDMIQEVRREFPQAAPGEPKVRTTRDKQGNRWIWKAHQAVHGDIEPQLSKMLGGVDLHQSHYTPNHREVVREAIRNRQPVPSHVREEYPEWAEFFDYEPEKYRRNWNEADHPRMPAGSDQGGEFTDKQDGTGSTSAAAAPSGRKPTPVAQRGAKARPTPAHLRTPQAASPAQPEPDFILDHLNHHSEKVDRFKSGQATADEVKAAFRSTLNREASIKSDLARLSKADLAGRTIYGMTNPGASKRQLVQAAWEDMLKEHALAGVDWNEGQESHEDAIRRSVDSLTDLDVRNYASLAQKHRAETEELKRSHLDSTIGREGRYRFEDAESELASRDGYSKKFDESKHPRAGKGENGGQFVPLAGQKDFFGGEVSEEEAKDKQAKIDSENKAAKAKAAKEQRDAAKAEKANAKTAFDQGKLFQNDEQGGLFDRVYEPKKKESPAVPSIKNGDRIRKGDRFDGYYMGKKISGTVQYIESDTTGGPDRAYVKLDQPTDIHYEGDTRQRIIFDVVNGRLADERAEPPKNSDQENTAPAPKPKQEPKTQPNKESHPAPKSKQNILTRATGNTQKRLFSRRGSYDVHADGDMVLIQYARKPAQGQKSLFGDTNAGGRQKGLFEDRKPKQPKNPEFEAQHPRDDDGTFVEKEGGGRLTYKQAQEQYASELWETINQRWDDGEMVGVTTRTRYTPLESRHRDRVRLHNGEIQVQERDGKWSTVAGESLDSLARSAGMQSEISYIQELDIIGTSQEEIDEKNAQEKANEDASEQEIQGLADKHFGGDVDAFAKAEGEYIAQARQDANDYGVDWPETEELEQSFREGLSKPKEQPEEGEAQQAESAPDDSEKATIDEVDEKPMATGHGASLGDIPFELATLSHSGTSWVPDRRGAAEQQNYVDHMANVYESMLAKAKTDEAKKLLQSEFARYRRGYAEKLKDYLGSKSRIVSSMIAGPSNFPVRQMEKRSDAAHKKLQALLEYDKKAQRAIEKKLQPEKQPIRIGDSDAMQRLQTKLSNLERLQDAMKAANKIIRKAKGSDVTAELMELGLSERSAKAAQEPDYMGRIGFPDYSLKNNNANIRRVRGQIQDQERRESVQAESESGSRPSDFEFSGGLVRLDYDDNRLRIEFDQKPDRETIAKLKSNGFKWSRANSAWQRQLTENAKRAASTVTGADVE